MIDTTDWQPSSTPQTILSTTHSSGITLDESLVEVRLDKPNRQYELVYGKNEQGVLTAVQLRVKGGLIVVVQ